jgi:hypothetical protein
MSDNMPPPIRYLRHYWFQLVVAAGCIIKGFATTNPVFTAVPVAPLWPYVLWASAVLVIASTFAPLARRLQAAAGASLIAVATLRIIAYLVVLSSGTIPDTAHPLIWYLIGSWSVTGAVGLTWQKLAESSALAETVEVGRNGGD